MKALIYLFFLRLKGQIRNVFSKPSSAIFVLFMILVYGGLMVGILAGGNRALTMLNLKDINIAIFVGIGFTAFMVCVMLLQTRKALFDEKDAFYLFAGPFTQSQFMQYIMSQSIIGAISCGAISLFMMIIFGNAIQYSFQFAVLILLTHGLVYLFFTTLYYYVYLLSIKKEKYKYISYAVVGFFALIVMGIFVAVLAQNDFEFTNIGIQFLNSDLFNLVPLFGWVKMILVSYIAGNMGVSLLGFALLLGAWGIVYWLMLHYKGDFIEKAMQDAIEFTARYKEAKAGRNANLKFKKVRNVKFTGFREGAGAILSKNFLVMKKSNSFISIQDIFLITIYLIMAFIMDLDFSFFIYLMMIWLFISLQNAEFMHEMDNYQIYLIPEPPLTKLWNLLAPYFLKYVVLVAFPLILGIVLLGGSLNEFIQYYFLLAGYACLFISGSVLATKFLKSRNSPLLENMLRMLILFAAAIPSVIMIVFISMVPLPYLVSTVLLSVLPLLINFILSAIILYSCKNMMNGREIKSE